LNFECLMCNSTFYVFPVDLDAPQCPYCGTKLPSIKPLWDYSEDNKDDENGIPLALR